jgi:acyl-CoA synthetase (AMP-forming)/AMP-acid ligase II
MTGVHRSELTPVAFLHRAAYLHPARVALAHEDGRRIAYGELQERCHRLANALRDRGLRRGLAALRALYRQDHVLAPGAAAISERDRRIDFLRTAPLRALLEFLGSADYRHALGEPDAQTETDAGS